MLQRRFDCNCHACSRATYPHEHENVDPMIDRNGAYVIRGCLRDADSSDDYENRCVRRLDNQAEQALRKASEKVGNELAKEWNAKRIGAGQCLLVQNSDPTADGHQLWCCRTVNCTEYKLRSADMGMDYGGCVLQWTSRENKNNAKLCRAGCWRTRNHRAMVRAGSVSRGRREAHVRV